MVPERDCVLCDEDTLRQMNVEPASMLTRREERELRDERRYVRRSVMKICEGWPSFTSPRPAQKYDAAASSQLLTAAPSLEFTVGL